LPLQTLRNDLLDLLADVEAGLDFSEEDIRFVAREDLLERLSAALAQLQLLERQLAERGISATTFRAALAGRPNAGKSSLFNALIRKGAALVSPVAGTTRDYLVQRLDLDGVTMELIDSAGWQYPGSSFPSGTEEQSTAAEPAAAIEQQAQTLGREQAGKADLVLLCVEAGQAPDGEEQQLLRRGGQGRVVGVSTKCDRHAPAPGWLATSAVTGAGLESLRDFLKQQLETRRQPPLAPSLSRCRHHVQASLESLRRAQTLVLDAEPAELLAVELRGALEELGALVGAIYTDDLLDRIFSRFCIGK
jgi:tRNA modification GTPase